MQYKTVAAPIGLTINAGEGAAKAVATYSELISKEAVGGWELHSIESIPVEEKPGCFAALFGAKSTTTYFNMLIFKKED